MRRVAVALVICFAGVFVSAQRGPARPLEIWVIDVEGGKAALYVTPTGQTAIIDTGFPGERDLDRILAAIGDAGVKQIDYLVSTHYHVDHIGNLVELARRVPVGTFVDHGQTVEGPNVTQVPPGRMVSRLPSLANRSKGSRRRMPISTTKPATSSSSLVTGCRLPASNGASPRLPATC